MDDTTLETYRVERVNLLCFLSQPVGCDLIVNSSVRKDRCGICDGDNSTCDVIQNTFTAQPRKNSKTFRGDNCIKNFHLG